MRVKLPASVVKGLKRGLDLHKKGKGGKGLVPETIKLAREGVSRGSWPDWKVVKASNWFARHVADRRRMTNPRAWNKAPNYSPAYVAWTLWGDDGSGAGRRWIDKKAKELKAQGVKASPRKNPQPLMVPAKILGTDTGEYRTELFWKNFRKRPKEEQLAWAEKHFAGGIREPLDVRVYADGSLMFSDGHHRAKAATLLDKMIPIRISRNQLQEKSDGLWEYWLDLVLQGFHPTYDLNPERWNIKTLEQAKELVAQGVKASPRKNPSRTQAYKYGVPAKYLKGLSDKVARQRAAEIIRRRKRGIKTDKPLPGDRQARSKPMRGSKWTRAYHKQYGSGAGSNLSKIAKETGFSEQVIREVYKRGVGASRTAGRRPGATDSSWALARVHAFVMKAKHNMAKLNHDTDLLRKNPMVRIEALSDWGDDQTLDLDNLGRGQFKKAYKTKGRKPKAIIVSDTDSYDHEILGSACSAYEGTRYAAKKHIPCVKKIGWQGNKPVFEMDLYRAPLRKGDSLKAWEQYVLLKKANEQALQEEGAYGWGYNIYDNVVVLNRALEIFNKMPGRQKSVYEALETIKDEISNYGSTYRWEFTPRNLATDAKGNLILLDVFFDQQVMVRRTEKKQRGAARWNPPKSRKRKNPGRKNPLFLKMKPPTPRLLQEDWRYPPISEAKLERLLRSEGVNLAQTAAGEYRVSTGQLPTSLYGEMFETLVFNGKHSVDGARFRSIEDAKEYHEDRVRAYSAAPAGITTWGGLEHRLMVAKKKKRRQDQVKRQRAIERERRARTGTVRKKRALHNPPLTSRHPMLLRHIVRGMFVQGSDPNATKTKAEIKKLVAMYGKHDLDPREELNLAFGTATNSLVNSGKIRKSKDGRRWVLTEKGKRASAKKRREQSSAQMKRKDQQYEWILEFTRKGRR